VGPIGSLNGVDLLSSSETRTHKDAASAAKEFEALMLSSMLRSLRESSSGGFSGTEGDSASSSAIGFAEEHLAQALASQGGLGLARLIGDSLAKK
jgi:Rod binding domain-containing protein